MISYKYNFKNKSGAELILNDHNPLTPDHVYALQSYPSISKSVKNNELDRNGQNNYWDFFSYYGKLSFNFSGIIVAENEIVLEQMKQDLLRVFSLPLQPTDINDGHITMEWQDNASVNKSVEVKLTNDIQFDRPLGKRYIMNFIIQLKAKTNYILDAGTPATATGTRAWYQQGGIILPTLLPLSWNPNWQNTLTVNIIGNGGFPVIRVYGESQQKIINPKITNTTTGEVFLLNLDLENQNSWVEIDTENGTVMNNFGNDVSGFVDLDSSFINLVTGENKFLYTSDNDPYVSGLLPTAVLEIKYKNYYAI